MAESRACRRIRAGEPFTVSGPFGNARVNRDIEGFSATVNLSSDKTVKRRFSDPSAAIYWAYGLIKPNSPGWLR